MQLKALNTVSASTDTIFPLLYLQPLPPKKCVNLVTILVKLVLNLQQTVLNVMKELIEFLPLFQEVALANQTFMTMEGMSSVMHAILIVQLVLVRMLVSV